jgi:hypothetical protein
MNTSIDSYPDLRDLEAGLQSVLLRKGMKGKVTVRERRPNVYKSSFPSEIVTCTTSDTRTLQLFLKYYDGKSFRDVGHGHRGGVEYEAMIYRYILSNALMSSVQFYGTYQDPDKGSTWLVLEYLDRSMRVGRVPDQKAVIDAASWIGKFHRSNEAGLSGAGFPFLITYDRDYYEGWAHRTLEYSAPLHKRFPWLETVCNQYRELVPLFMSSPATVIHGEYYQNNILFHEGIVYPVDWESAAAAQGEIDLACFMDGWSDDMFQDCKDAYTQARWPDGPPFNVEQTIDIARLYVQFRWLGDWPTVTVDKNSLTRFERLRSVSEGLKLI